MSTQIIVKGLDPTGFGSIAGAQLATLVDGSTLASDKGVVFTTADVAGNPTVVNATGAYAFLQQCLWRRLGASSVVMYQWNPNIASDPTFLNWQAIAVAAMPANSITNAMLQAGSVTDNNIVGMAWTKLTGIPATFAPGGQAGAGTATDILSGQYPNPIINPNAVNVIPIAALQYGTAGQMLRTNGAGNAVEFASFGIVQRRVITIAGQKSTVLTSSAGNPGVAEGLQLAQLTNFTPTSGTSIIRIALIGELYPGQVASASAIAALYYGNTLANYVSTDYVSTTPKLTIATSCETHINSWGAGVAKNVQARLSTTAGTNSAYIGINNAVTTFIVEEWFGGFTAI